MTCLVGPPNFYVRHVPVVNIFGNNIVIAAACNKYSVTLNYLVKAKCRTTAAVPNRETAPIIERETTVTVASGDTRIEENVCRLVIDNNAIRLVL
jgi:hypothetical protein